MPDEEILDAYSAAVVRVARKVLPGVASLRVHSRRGDGGGSASVLSADGYLLTSAHVVDGATASPRRSPTAPRPPSTSPAATPCPTWPS